MNPSVYRQRRSLLGGAMVGILYLLACTNADPTAFNNDRLEVGRVAVAAPAPFPYSAGVYSQFIDERGGNLDFGIGEIAFPSGAIAEETLIRATVDGERVSVTFEPTGLQFSALAQPVLRFRLSTLQKNPAILYVDHSNVVLDMLPARVAEGPAVEAPLPHFSKYIFGVE